jgi:hypothetical protein
MFPICFACCRTFFFLTLHLLLDHTWCLRSCLSNFGWGRHFCRACFRERVLDWRLVASHSLAYAMPCYVFLARLFGIAAFKYSISDLADSTNYLIFLSELLHFAVSSLRQESALCLGTDWLT